MFVITPTFETSRVELQISYRKTMPLTLRFVTQKVPHEENERHTTFKTWNLPEVVLRF